MDTPVPMTFQAVIGLQQSNELAREAARLQAEQAARLALRDQREALENRQRTMNAAQLARSFVAQADTADASPDLLPTRTDDHVTVTQGAFPPPPSGPVSGT